MLYFGEERIGGGREKKREEKKKRWREGRTKGTRNEVP